MSKTSAPLDLNTLTLKPCQCGCGEPAPLAKRNNARRGHVKGQPLAYVSGHNRRGTTQLDRFEVTEDGCWRWTGSTNRKGYGRAQVGGVHRHAHRAIYEAFVEPVDKSLHLDHLCRNTACVNPDHLEPVTPAENDRRRRLAAGPHDAAALASLPEVGR